ncbi:MAG: glycine--tRNA ligase subunit beta [Stellaceae bacterium]
MTATSLGEGLISVISQPDAAQSAAGSPGEGDLLIELLSEEIPARMQRRAIEDLTGLVRDKLAAAEIPASDMRGYVTPRRLAVIAEGIPATQPDRGEERRGPRVGAPPPAIEGFVRSAGLGGIEECEIRDTGRGQFYFAVVRRSGRPTAEVLPELIKAAIIELPWQKSMRWPGSPLRWVRPLTSVICLYDGAVLPLALDSIPVGRVTRGHRFLAPGEICVATAAGYVEKLRQAHVILDQDQRRELIRAELDRRAAELGVAVKPDPALLDEVTGLAEFPVVLAGAIDPDFMALPPEVLQTAMRTHQKYFSCVHSDGRPAPLFLFVANNLAKDGGKAIIAGNERVLRARLADARFFWDQDRKVRLRSRIENLKQRVYHEKLGSMFDKAQRMAGVAHDLAPQLRVDQDLALGAALLAKADLSTGMVGEFPELQGVMGRYYALNDKEDRRVADAIAEHYRPLGPSDDCPTKPISVVVALADRIDALVGFFAIGEKPTGSRDPFALRRAALGIIRLVFEKNLHLKLSDVFQRAWLRFVNIDGSNPTTELIEFVVERLKIHLRAQRVRHDLIAAALVRTTGIPEVKHLEDDLVRLIKRVRALESFLATDDGSNLLVAYRRAANIVAIEEKRDGRLYGDRSPDFSPAMLQPPEIRNLVESAVAINASSELRGEDFNAVMARLAGLRRPVDEFFDRVTVNTDDPALRENRLRLLAMIRVTMNRVADFSLIEG